MANALFVKAKESLLSQNPSIDLDTDDIKVVLVDHGVDTPVPATDQYLSDISTAVVATSGVLTGKSISGGIFDANDVTFSSVSGASCESIVIYKDTGNAATSPLIAFIDTATGLPVTPNGGNIVLYWDNGGSKIFAL